MNKMRNLISALLGLAMLAALAAGLAWLLGPQGALPLIYASRRVKGVSRRRRP